MCGISGIVSTNNIAKDLLSSIRNLEYRGYDSCGMATFKNGKILTKKNTGTVDEVDKKEQLSLMTGTVGIAHTRWATHGGVTRDNSHPHFSANEEFAIVHNGIFSNYQELKEKLLGEGTIFRSMTDSEVFAHLIERAYKRCHNVEEAFVTALNQVEGAFATAMLTVHQPEYLYCAKNISPLILGMGEERHYIGSDINAFLEFTKTAISLDDDDYAILSKDQYWIKNAKTRRPVQKQTFTINWDIETTKKGGYSHYMLKEIFDQPYTAKQALKIEIRKIRKMAAMVQQSRQCFLVGVGTTFYVAMVGQYLFTQFARRYLPAVSSDEFQDNAILTKADMMLTLSQSGETYDTKMAINFARIHQTKTAAIVNVMGSAISMMVDHVIMQGSGAEICVVSTKAAFSQMIILLRIVLELALTETQLSPSDYEQYCKILSEFPEIIEAALNEQSGFIRNMARQSSQVHNWLFLGCGIYYPIAMESALKMKEVTYLHSEGMSTGFLKHGTLAMIDDSLYSLFFIPPPEQQELHHRTLVAVEEIKARGGTVLGFVFDGDRKAIALLDHWIQLPRVHYLVAPFLQLIMAQLFAYYTALDLGRNIDKPRNLAKSVTVA